MGIAFWSAVPVTALVLCDLSHLNLDRVEKDYGARPPKTKAVTDHRTPKKSIFA